MPESESGALTSLAIPLQHKIQRGGRGRRIRTLEPAWRFPCAEKTELYTKQKILQALRQKQIKAPWNALFVKEKIFFKRG